MSGTTGGGAFRYPYDHDDITYQLREELTRLGVNEDVLLDWSAHIMDRDRALEDYSTYAAGSIVKTVASDGTGDYTSIKVAIEAVPTGFTALIFVKNGAYDDSASGVVTQVVNTNITVWGVGPFASPSNEVTPSLPLGVSWTFDSYTLSSSGGTGSVSAFKNMVMTGTSATSIFLPSISSWTIQPDHCALQVISAPAFTITGGGNSTTPSWKAYNSTYTVPLFSSTGSTTVGLTGAGLVQFFQGCVFQFCDATITVLGPSTGTTSSVSFEVQECNLSINTSLQMSGNGTATLAAGRLIFQDSTLNLASGITWTIVNGGPFVLVNCNDGPRAAPATAPIISINNFTTAQVVKRRSIISGNDLYGYTLQIALGTDLGRCSASGNYRRLVIDSSNFTFTGHLNPQAAGDTAALRITGDNNTVFCSMANFGAAGTGVQIIAGGDNNFVIASGTGNFGTPISNLGSGNSINSLPPNGVAGGALSGTYANPDEGAPYWMNVQPTAVSGRLPKPSLMGDVAARGADTAGSPSDHVHDRQGDAALHYMDDPAGAPKTGPRVALASVAGDAAASGVDQTPARIDHMHDRQSDAALYWMIVSP